MKSRTEFVFFDDVPKNNPIFGKYVLACTHEGCVGRKIIDQAMSAGLAIGSIVSPNDTDHNFGRCPHCKRHKMRVVEVPEGRAPSGPKGFVKVPTK